MYSMVERPAYMAENEKAKLEIHYDTSPESPREWPNLGVMVCWHRRYNLGDRHEYRTPEEFENAFDPKHEGFEGEEIAARLPLYLYDHSGITMNTTGFSDRWDSGQVGWVYVTKKQLREEYHLKRVSKKAIRKALEVMRAEVKTYDQYISGEVYGFVFTNKETNEEDSCWGFYGSDFENNGITEYIPEEHRNLVAELK